MARRVALARALALDPPLMVYDEPLTGLDPIASGVIMSLIARLNDSLGLTSIIVTHHVHETLPVADRAIVIANGKIVFSGTPAELEATSDPLVLQFRRGAGRADRVRYGGACGMSAVRSFSFAVIPAKAGTQRLATVKAKTLGSRFRG